MNKCQWCGFIHETKCSLVKAIEYHQDGTPKRVEFYAPNDYVSSLYGLSPALLTGTLAPGLADSIGSEDSPGTRAS